MTWNPWHYVVMLAACLVALLVAGKMDSETRQSVDKATTIIISGLIGMAYTRGGAGRASDQHEPPRRPTPTGIRTP